MGHTKGPWSLGRTLTTNQTLKWTSQQIAENDAIERSQVFAFFRAEDGGKSRVRVAQVADSKESEANARLISAAPDMLDALKECVRLGMIPSEEALPKSTTTEYGTAARMVLAVIAKAEGKQ